MADVGVLNLQIKANAGSAATSLGNLADALSRVKSAVGRGSMSNNIEKVASAIERLKQATQGGANSRALSSITKSISDATKQLDSGAVNRLKTATDAIERYVNSYKSMSGVGTTGKTHIGRIPLNLGQFGEKNVSGLIAVQSEVQSQVQEAVKTSESSESLKEVQKVAEGYEECKENLKVIEHNIEKTKGTLQEAAKGAKAFKENLTEKAGEKKKGFLAGLKDLGKDIGKLIPKFTLLNRVMRIASTMLIRMGVRALFKGAKEGFNNFYEYSKATGGAFASEMDGVYSTWNQIKNQLGASIATAFSAAIPVINSLANAAITAFNYLSQLIALLTGKSSWSKATAQVSDYGDAINKATGKSGGGGMKELLAQFDELNVIASESGGGGGGAAAQAAESFTDMFEEMTNFDSKIRDIADFIKGFVDWIKENLDIVLATIGLIGVAILGWKISEAFDGALKTLGKIIAGGALVTLGVILSFDFGTKLGESLAGGKGVSWGDIVEGIAGIVAAGIGGYMIGGGIGAGIGIAFSIMATIVGIVVGWKNEKDKQKWGQRSLTPEDIHRYVISQFDFDVEVEVELVDTKISNARAAKAHLNGAISEFSRELDKIKLGIDTSPEAILSAKTSMDTVIASLKSYTKESENLISAYVQIMPYDNETKTGIQKDILSANNQLNNYFKEQGEKAALLYDQGMSDGWAKNEQKQILDLMEHVNNIFTGADMNRATNEAISASSLNLADLTRDTAEKVLEEQKKILEEHKKAMKDAAMEISTELMYYADLSDAAGLIDETTGEALGDTYRKRAKEILDGFEDEYAKKLATTKEAMKDQWIKALSDVYGTDVKANFNQNWAGIVKDFRASLGKGEKAMKTTFKYYMEQITNISPIAKEASELFGISAWDIMAEDAKEDFVKYMYQGIGMEAVSILKSELKISASDIIAITNWRSFSSQQKIEFVQALVDAYGSTEALEAAKKAGIDIQQTITDAISEGGKAKEAADKLMAVINEEAQKNKVNVNADVNVNINAIVTVTANVKNGIVNGMDAIVRAAQARITKNAEGAYGIPRGDLFIANEEGAELVGSIGGKTSVANQGQIIEGISSGVERANAEQNVLLRQQNELLRGILEKEYAVKLGASPALGRTVQQSLNMYDALVGG